MKFQNVEAFDRHIAKTNKAHLAHIFFIAIDKAAERRETLRQLLTLFTEREIKRFSLSDGEVDAFVAETGSLSLFQEKKVLILESQKSFSKEQETKVQSTLASLDQETVCVVLAPKITPKLYDPFKASSAFLDLSLEKPWDRTKRLNYWAARLFTAAKIGVSSDVINALTDAFQDDFDRIFQECQKLIHFKGTGTLTLKECEGIVQFPVNESGWTLASQVVWGEKGVKGLSLNDASEFFPLLGQVRYHLQSGLKMHALLKAKREADIASVFPRLKGKRLDILKRQALDFKETYYKKGLCSLFDIEHKAKQSLAPLPILWTMLGAKLQHLRDHS